MSRSIRAGRPAPLRVEQLEDRVNPGVITPFTPRFTANETGDISLVGNTLVTISAANNPGRTQQQVENALSGIGSLRNNNNWVMSYADVDGDPTTFNSSRAGLNLPAGAEVLFAGLYWGGDTTSAARNQVKFATPGGGYLDLAGTIIGSQTGNSGNNDYQGFADVTALVQAAGNGTYTVANVQAQVGVTDRQAGWGLVVAFRAPGLPPRNLTVFDGFASVSNSAGNNNVTIPISGFRTPGTGPVRAAVGIIAYEGDLDSGGASLRLNGTPLTNAANPADNFFNSTISDRGANVTDRDPAPVNQLGFDIDRDVTTNLIPNGATSAQINLRTGGETYFPGVVTTAIDLFAPRLTVEKTVEDLTPPNNFVLSGDRLRYTVVVTNAAGDTAQDVSLSDLIPGFTTYAPGTVVVDGVAQTDAAGDDRTTFAGGGLTVNLGAGATPTSGGTLAIGASTTITFEVTVDAATPDSTAITNTAEVEFTGADLGQTFTASDAVTVVTPPAADLALTKTASDPTPSVGGLVTFTVTLRNLGPSAATGVVVQDSLPAGLTLVGTPAASAGTYDAGTGQWSIPTLAAGTTATLTLSARVNSLGVTTNTAAVTASDVPDINPANDQATAGLTPAVPALRLTKAAAAGRVPVGGVAVFTIRLTNTSTNGATAFNLVVQETLPPALRFVSARPSVGTFDPATGRWTLPQLAAGETQTLTIRARVLRPGVKRNTATATADFLNSAASVLGAGSAVTGFLPPATPSKYFFISGR